MNEIFARINQLGFMGWAITIIATGVSLSGILLFIFDTVARVRRKIDLKVDPIEPATVELTSEQKEAAVKKMVGQGYTYHGFGNFSKPVDTSHLRRSN
ncbi:MAG: hypothetical protein U0487_00535 [Patescibacteria group bacterium]